MARLKIDYGIDLGTTNSAICRMEKGEPVIIKTDVLKDTMPSCVSFTKRKTVKAGDSAFNDMKSDKRRATKGGKITSNSFVEFKRTMGTDKKYPVKFKEWEDEFSSEQLSAEVLKTLKSFVTDENVKSAVITVPAKFTVTQKTATMEAAKLAGFEHCELLQEPIAAAMAYGLTTDSKNGIWMVFDFGGGTFDAALLKVEDGIMQVFDTEGDNYLGGKNLDYAIVDSIIIPYLEKNFSIDGILEDDAKKNVLREAMKTWAEDVKNQLSFKEHEDILSNLGDLGEDEDGEEMELDLPVTQYEINDVMRPYFQKAVDICKVLLQRNNLKSDQLTKLILVGGPTHSPLVRQMLCEQITPNVDTSIDPMTAVATGAALYASTIDAEVKAEDLTIDTIKLNVGYEATSVEQSEWVSITLDGSAPLDKVSVELIRSDKAWSSGKTEVDKNGNVIEAQLLESKPNSFSIVCYDDKGNSVPCFPDEITIIQGSKVGAAPLPYNIGISVYSSKKKRSLFSMAKGLEKNKPVPATGVIQKAMVTPVQLRPGVETDHMIVPVYQVDDFAEAEGRSVALYEHVGNIEITGDDIESLIPADSDIEITLKVDSNEQMTLVAYFPATDMTVEKTLDTSKKQSVENAAKQIPEGLHEAKSSIQRLKDAGIDTSALEDKLAMVQSEADNSSEKKMVLQHLKEVRREIETLDEGTEWQRLEQQLREQFARLEKAQADLGNDKSAAIVSQLRSQTEQAIQTKDVKVGHEVLEAIYALYFHLTMLYQLIGIVRYYDNNFESQPWSNRQRAQQLLNTAKQTIVNNPTTEALMHVVRAMYDLLPEENQHGAGGIGIREK